MANLSSQYSPIIFIDKVVAISSRKKGGCAFERRGTKKKQTRALITEGLFSHDQPFKLECEK